MSRPRILLLDNHDSYTYNLYQLLWEISGTRPDVVGNDEATVEELLRERYTHVVISPGPGSPERPEDIGVGAGLVARIQVPCLGVCLGHQAIAVACGGLVAPAPAIRHGWVGDVRHRGRGLFEGIPRRFRAVRYHSLAVAAPLPDALRVTAWCDDGVIMAVEHRDRPLWGVQFHPESVLTEFGDRLVANFLGGLWAGEGPTGPQRRRPRSKSRTEPWTRPCTGRRTESQARVRGPLAGRGNDPGTVHWRLLPFGVRPETAFSRLFADQPYCFWLDGARQSDGMGRYSFMGAAGGEGWSVLRSWDGGRSAIVETPLGATSTGQSLLECLRCGLGPPVAAGDVPVPFVGGYVGYLGYGVKESLGIGKPEAVTGSEQDSGSPDAELLRVDRLVAFDHATGRAFLVTSRVEAPSALAWFEEMTGRLAELPAEQPAQDPAAIPAVTPSVPPGATEVHDSVDRATYGEHLARIREWLAAGESYEACYTYQITGRSPADPLAVYLRLRRDNPAPYAAYLRFGDRRVLSCSPERFLLVDERGWAETKPIKGTAPRLPDPRLDVAAASGLAAGEKTRAENLMIVDLLRNDLGRVCRPGTVSVPALMAVESYASVHQLVSTVRGRLRGEIDALDCLAALFPGGSMTGAPKQRTVELLDDLESSPRGVYSGCLGYVGFDGRTDQSIVIRTLVWAGDRFSLGVGGAITALSDPDEEYAETRLKARALLAAVSAPQCGTAGGVLGEGQRDRRLRR